MSNRIAALSSRNTAVWVTIASFLVAMLLPVLTAPQRVDAAQILDRYIDMGSSASSAENDYDVSFQLPNGVVVGSVRVEFCNVDPLPGETCATGILPADNVPRLDAGAGSAVTLTNFAIADTAGDTTDNAANCSAPSLQAIGASANHIDIECGTGNAETTSVAETGAGTTTDTEYINFTLNDVDNPSNATSGTNNDTFYVRIYVFASPDVPAAYVQASPPLGNYEGGLALSTANQINVTARVQEELTFRVGADNVGTVCDTFTDTTVDLGVLDSNSINLASSSPVGGDVDTACVEVTTNAANGVNVYYIGDNLKVTGAVCGTTDTEDGSPDTGDQCLNSDEDGSDADNNTFSASPDITTGTEQWGMSVLTDTLENAASNETTNLSLVTKYDGDSGATATNNWTFVPNTAELIGSATTVVNAEVLEIDMAGTAAITTPTGVYTTTLTFIATATF